MESLRPGYHNTLGAHWFAFATQDVAFFPGEDGEQQAQRCLEVERSARGAEEGALQGCPSGITHHPGSPNGYPIALSLQRIEDLSQSIPCEPELAARVRVAVKRYCYCATHQEASRKLAHSISDMLDEVLNTLQRREKPRAGMEAVSASRGNDGLTEAERAELAERYAQRATLTESDAKHIKRSREDAGQDGRSNG